ncbi:MAG: MCE family protein [Oligosphaeraceae bacterium]|nr:MCE family protein [Oligosphaeraceae bacterium]
MGVKTKTTVIGIFVVLAITLALIMTILLGGRNFFAASLEYKLYFDKSVKGLSVGSPVMFRGVRVGQVSSIALSYRDDDELPCGEAAWLIEVVAQLQPAAFGMKRRWQDCLPEGIHTHLFEDDKLQDVKSVIRHLVEKESLRAQLHSLSLLTGQLFIELNFFPGSEWTEQQQKDLQKGILPVEISSMDRLKQSFSRKDYSNPLDSITIALHDLSIYINEGKFRQLLDDLSTAAHSANQMLTYGADNIAPLMRQVSAVFLLLDNLLAKMENELGPMLSNAESDVNVIFKQLQQVSKDVGDLALSAKEFIARLDRMGAEYEPALQEMMDNLKVGSQSLAAVMPELADLVAELKASSSPESELYGNVNEVLLELRNAASAMRGLAEFLRRQPESLLRGKGEK